jgi:hypothetical protein
MRICLRVVEGVVCGRDYAGHRTVAVMTAASAPADMEYFVDLCAEHIAEYDRDHV